MAQGNQECDPKVHDVPAGAYRVRRISKKKNHWVPDTNGNVAVQVNSINTKHLAISGHCSDIGDAANYTPKFIWHGHGVELHETYTLFFNPSHGFFRNYWRSLCDSFGIGETLEAKKLATLLIEAAQRDRDINVTVYGSGHALFKEALRVVNRTAQVKLNRFTVFYAHPTHNLGLVDKWRARTGMQLVNKLPLITVADPRQFLLSGNLISATVLGFKVKSEDRWATLFDSILEPLKWFVLCSFCLRVFDWLATVLG